MILVLWTGNTHTEKKKIVRAQKQDAAPCFVTFILEHPLSALASGPLHPPHQHHTTVILIVIGAASTHTETHTRSDEEKNTDEELFFCCPELNMVEHKFGFIAL